MRGFLLFLISFLFVCNVHSQEFSAKDFLYASTLSSKKLETYLNKNRFLFSGSRVQNDTMINIYSLKPVKKKKGKDTLDIKRSLETFHLKKSSSFTYITSLKKEYTESLQELKEAEFFCGNENDTAAILFQKKNFSVLAKTIIEDDDTLYSLAINQQILPLPEDIQFAEDLLQFYSHE